MTPITPIYLQSVVKDFNEHILLCNSCRNKEELKKILLPEGLLAEIKFSVKLLQLHAYLRGDIKREK